MTVSDQSPALSICIPVFNEEKNIPLLLERITKVLQSRPEVAYEIILVDDASADGSWRAMTEARANHPRLRCLRFEANRGESAAQEAAMKAARGALFMTMDADLENDPADIPLFLDAIGGCDCVCGTRVGRRKDGWLKTLSSRFANGVRGRILQDHITDAGCTYRLFKRACFEAITMYNGFHRFLPTLFRMEGFTVTEIPVRHNERLHGESKYGVWNRLFKSFADMLAVRWMKNRKLRYVVKQEI